MKVGLITYGLDRPLTGISRYAIELARALAGLEDGPEITLLEAGSSAVLKAGIVRRVPLPGCRLLPGLMILGNFLLPLQARRLKLDVVHDPNGLAPFLFGAGPAKIVVTLHDVIPWSYPGASRPLETLIYRHWLPRTIGRARAVITASTRSRSDILRFLPVPQDRLSVLPYGVARWFHPLPPAQTADRLAARFGLDSPYLFYAGSSAPRKNVARLIRAFLSLAEEFPRLRLVLTGPRAKDKNLAPIVNSGGQSADRIIFTGSVPDAELASLYNGCELFIFPSLYEGFGLPALEAMACGAPVVCSNSSSLPEVVGDAALLVDPSDVRALSDAVRAVLTDDRMRAEMRQKGLQRTREFTWERNAALTMAVYRKVVYH